MARSQSKQKSKAEILNITSLEMFERIINKDSTPFDLGLMVMPGTLEEKHRNCETIPALRRQFNLIYLLLDGEHDVKLGADHLQLKPNDLVVVPENTVYASDHIRNCKGYCVHFKSAFLRPQLSRSLMEEFPFFHYDANHIINLTDTESEQIQQAFRNIIEEYDRSSCEKNALLCNLILILLFRIREIYRKQVSEPGNKPSRKALLAHKFKLLVEQQFIEMRTVNAYADKLNVSSKYLSEAVRETFGRPPLQIIHDMLLLEAKVQLGSTDKSISEIAFALQFDDQPHFSNFIRKRTGMTPQDFRRKP